MITEDHHLRPRGAEPAHMDNLLDDLVRITRKCERTASLLEQAPLSAIWQRLQDAIGSVEAAWSRSWVGYHAHVYLSNLRPPKSGEVFDIRFGLGRAIDNLTRGNWKEFTFQEIESAILLRAGLENFDVIKREGDKAERVFDQSRQELLPLIDAFLATREEPALKDVRKQIADLDKVIGREQFAEAFKPPYRVMTGDLRALECGVKSATTPPDPILAL